MRLVDVHCHLESDEFTGGLENILAGARAAGIVKLVTASIVPEQWPVSRALARRFTEVEFACGIHPWHIQPAHMDALPRLCAAKEDGACAIGEIGLDTKIDSPDIGLQRTFFEAQLRIAKETDLPVVIHCRGAFDDLIRSLKSIGLSARGGVVHNFSGSAELARQLAKQGLRFSFGGALTYRNSRKKREALRAAYPDHLLLETDSPDIAPVEAPERPNVPANILYNLRAAAELLGEPEEDIAEHSYSNACELFGFQQQS